MNKREMTKEEWKMGMHPSQVKGSLYERCFGRRPHFIAIYAFLLMHHQKFINGKGA